MKSERKLFASAVLATAGAVTPLAAHAAGASCWIFLPAHVPPLLAGLALGPVAGLVTGGVTALADLLWGGRVQGIAFLPIGVELVAYGLVAGLLASRCSVGYGARLAALLGAMVIGRLAYLVAAVVLDKSAASVLRGLFVMPWPGMLIQIVTLPLASRLLERWSEG